MAARKPSKPIGGKTDPRKIRGRNGDAGRPEASRPVPRAGGRATLRDVADAAGVSPMTVSNLINGRLGSMRAETRQRIEAQIEKLGYRPHTMARSLRLAKRLSIGMVIVDDVPHYLSDPFITHVVSGLGNHLNANGYGLLLQGHSAMAFKNSPMVRDIRTDAICVMLSGSDAIRRDVVETLLGLAQPIVLFQETLKFPDVDLCSIRQDDRAGGRMLGQVVLEAGARRLAMLAPELFWPAIGERILGIREAIRHQEDAELRIVTCGDGEFRATQAALAQDLERHGLPDAILAGNDQMGISAMKLLAARGIKVPDQVLITGFNAFEFWQYTDPVLTTVHSPAYEIGARGGAEILTRLARGSFTQNDIVYSVALQRGGST
jgi:LacI family transcriptional regulator